MTRLDLRIGRDERLRCGALVRDVPGTGGRGDIALYTGPNEGCSTRLQMSGLPSFPPWSDVSGTA